MCNTIISNIEQQFRYTEPRLCTNSNCNNRTKWELNTEDSIYADWQKLRVQENPSDIPPGSMPRSIDVILRNELVEMCKPGDKCEFAGCLLVVPDIISLLKPGEKVQHQLKREAVRKEEQKPLDGVTGLKNLGIRDLTYKMIFIGQSVNFPENKQNPMVAINAQIKNDKSGKQVVTNNQDRFTDHEKSIIGEMKEQQNLYSKLAKCIAPGVYGHEDVKKGILLMLFGGVNKNTSEGIKLRGDLNVCIVGDPSVAKSQFLKYVCQLLPRAVYTSGKGSTAAGLTASVQRDSESGEFCIEAGALMLADNSICCIDEFDKMDSKDQVAIHEAMEQQTISIAKAGIQATLMARTSILAAANPLMGRYDKTKSLKYNIDISAPIMSRFDLFFVVVDERDDYSDFQIAEHIVGLHRAQNSENAEKTDLFKYDFSQEKFILYLRFAKSLNPRFTKEAAERLRDEYQGLRQSDISYQKTAYRITVRQLESLVRLSEALARVHLDTLIHPTYVSEAAKLLRKSIISVDMPNIELDNEFERKLQEDREKHQDNDDVVMMDADTRQQKNKIIISGGEYEKWKTRIVILIRELENNSNLKFLNIIILGVSVKHKDIIEYLCEENFDKLENHSEVEQFSEKINAIIERLINNDGILIVLNDDDNKFERILSVNVNYEPSSF
jgi:DNA replication licensing factor MCM6